MTSVLEDKLRAIKPIELHRKFATYCRCLCHESKLNQTLPINACQCGFFKRQIINTKFKYRQSLHCIDINKSSSICIKINNIEYNILLHTINPINMQKEILIHSGDYYKLDKCMYHSATATFFNQSVVYKIQINAKESVFIELRLKERYIKKFLVANTNISPHKYLEYIYMMHGYTKQHYPYITICNKNETKKLVLYFYCNNDTVIKTIKINNTKPVPYEEVYKRRKHLVSKKETEVKQLNLIIYWCWKHTFNAKNVLHKCPLMIFLFISKYYS